MDEKNRVLNDDDLDAVKGLDCLRDAVEYRLRNPVALGVFRNKFMTLECCCPVVRGMCIDRAGAVTLGRRHELESSCWSGSLKDARPALDAPNMAAVFDALDRKSVV